MKIQQAIDRFFFTPTSYKNLAFFRIAIGLFCILQIVGVYPDMLNIYGAQGLIRTEITEILLSDYFPRISWFSHFIAHFGVSEPDSVYMLAHIFIFTSIALTLGVATRLSAFLCWFIYLMFYGTGSVFSYGADTFLSISLFYCMVLPVGYYWTLDNLLWKRKERAATMLNTASIRVMQIHLAVAYFMGGFCKTLGTQWWNGEAIWRAVMLPQFNQFDMGWLASYPELSMILGWGVLALECLYPLLLFYRKTRLIGFISIVLMHLGIAMFMGLYYFALLMIILNTATFGWPYIEKWLQRFSSNKEPLEVVPVLINRNN